MKYLAPVLFAFLLISCSKNDSPVAPKSSRTPFDMSKYYVHYDTTYYKLWSDNFWEESAGIANISGTKFIKVVNVLGSSYLYLGDTLYAFAAKDSDLIWLETPVAPTASNWPIGDTLVEHTQFVWYDSYERIDVDSLVFLDTTSVSTKVGVLHGCPHIIDYYAQYYGSRRLGGDTTEVWFGRNLGLIKAKATNGYTHTITHAIVNGVEWGGTTVPGNPSQSLRRPIRSGEIEYLPNAIPRYIDRLHFTR